MLRNVYRISLVVLALSLLGGPVYGSTDFSANDELIGWSEDGLTWVTQEIQEGDETKLRRGYTVHRKNKTVAKYERHETATMRKKHPHVKLAAEWRSNFKKKYTTKSSHPKYDEERGRCMERWQLIATATGKPHHVHKAAWLCSTFYGGYEHPTKKFVLLKYMDDMSGKHNDGYCCSYDRKFRWVRIKAGR